MSPESFDAWRTGGIKATRPWASLTFHSSSHTGVRVSQCVRTALALHSLHTGGTLGFLSDLSVKGTKFAGKPWRRFLKDARRPISRSPLSRSRVTSADQSGASGTVSAVARARAAQCAADGQVMSRLGTRCSEKRKACTRGTRSC